ncbi:unnamed protein product [Lactuca saligna]|uniref:Uncharacterized protein n=1 Tax=Lactuca saligna TaxID=75948 RepID=A0AA35UWM5_LACSI|nr:unnamed protein product [Lactuca saligna]
MLKLATSPPQSSLPWPNPSQPFLQSLGKHVDENLNVHIIRLVSQTHSFTTFIREKSCDPSPISAPYFLSLTPTTPLSGVDTATADMLLLMVNAVVERNYLFTTYVSRVHVVANGECGGGDGSGCGDGRGGYGVERGRGGDKDVDSVGGDRGGIVVVVDGLVAVGERWRWWGCQ